MDVLDFDDYEGRDFGDENVPRTFTREDLTDQNVQSVPSSGSDPLAGIRLSGDDREWLINVMQPQTQ